MFCEKPLANSLKDAERMLAAVEGGVAHDLPQLSPRAPAMQLAKQIIAKGNSARSGTIAAHTCRTGCPIRPRPSTGGLTATRQAPVPRRHRLTPIDLARFLGRNHGRPENI
jgi:predicted dehydrogenase